MKIGELSQRCGISIRMLRYYEQHGVLAPRRTASGYREYEPGAEETLRRIALLREAGLTLETVRELLPCLQSRGHFTPCDKLSRILREELSALDARIAAQNQSRALLAGFLAGLPAPAPV
ncbi:MerR family transcriptional regulator [Chromobacterium sp. IIBBL 290-4]|uniref:MerR family transcriptional regulator n=1 Tax=Chromobacterium sp. IIBBL 290-4 TaxID=2953890 RepID=UPI0020B88EA6|nr:MerR family transcriptional regulator [Chromobacterium sp. IIBBL 290-4]UTH75803.1 MerR family transcriptional regulator [Chromobacterium sp. IIBBL 290-4]